jgi:hypothetical protein
LGGLPELGKGLSNATGPLGTGNRRIPVKDHSSRSAAAGLIREALHVGTKTAASATAAVSARAAKKYAGESQILSSNPASHSRRKNQATGHPMIFATRIGRRKRPAISVRASFVEAPGRRGPARSIAPKLTPTIGPADHLGKLVQEPSVHLVGEREEKVEAGR